MKTLVLGTGNKGKIDELKELLGDVRLDIRSLSEFGFIVEAAETGNTFAENAAIKAQHYARHTGRNVLADDSGLEVEVLGGRPGVFSARFAGENADDAQNNAKLLKELRNIDPARRTARFVCEMVLVDSLGKILFRADGFCYGTIAAKPFGSNGFGYDPLFLPDGFDKTFGELPENIKKSISHRAKAAAKIADFLGANSSVLT